MKDTLVTFEVAKLAKEKGFDVDAINCFDLAGVVYNVGYKNSIETNKPTYAVPT